MPSEHKVDKVPTGPGEAQPPPMTAEQFKNTPEFSRFRAGMKQLLKVGKAELDRRVKEAKGT